MDINPLHWTDWHKKTYLECFGWMKIHDDLWIDKDCVMEVSTEVAIKIQDIRNNYRELPWYKKLCLKIFGE